MFSTRVGKSLNRYFPELLDTLRAQLPDRCVLDGEIIILYNNAARFLQLDARQAK